jgi:hypothetical protein
VTISGRVSRREFASSGAAIALLSVLPVSLTSAPRPGSLARSRFAPFVGAAFRLTGDGDDAEVVLTDVGDLRPVTRTGDERRFSLLFTARRGRLAADGIRTLSSDRFGTVRLFVSPVGRGGQARHYQAVINRL